MSEFEVGFYGRMTLKAENVEQAEQKAREWQMAVNGSEWPELPDLDTTPISTYVEVGEASSAEEGREFRHQIAQKARRAS